MATNPQIVSAKAKAATKATTKNEMLTLWQIESELMHNLLWFDDVLTANEALKLETDRQTVVELIRQSAQANPALKEEQFVSFDIDHVISENRKSHGERVLAITLGRIEQRHTVTI